MSGKIVEGPHIYWGNYVVCKNTCNNDRNTFIEGNVYIWCPPSNAIYFENKHMGYLHWLTARNCFTVIDDSLKKVDELFNKLMSCE